MMKMTYQEMVNNFASLPRDVHTVPLDRRKPKWFHVYAENGALYVTNAETHEPSSGISSPRKLEEKKFDMMLDIYYRRKAGESVTKEALAASQNQVYWFGIFSELVGR